MKEFIEKLIGRLEEKENEAVLKAPNTSEFANVEYQKWMMKSYGFKESIEIVNELAEEYKGGCCEWKKHRDYWESKCDYHIEENWFSEIFSVAPDEYHCPYCGKKIKVV